MAGTYNNHTSILPDEMLLLVAEQLSTVDLLSFVLVNTAFHRVGVGVLLKPMRSVPLFKTYKNPDQVSLYTLNPCLFNEEYTAHIRSVTVRRHRSTYCSHIVLPELPRVNIIGLHCLYDDAGSGDRRLIHEDREIVTPRWNQFKLAREYLYLPEVVCSFLKLPSASTLVFVEVDNIHAPKIDEVMAPETIRSIKSVVFFLQPHQTAAPFQPVFSEEDDNEQEAGEHTEDEEDEELSYMDRIARFAPKNTLFFTLVYQSVSPTPCRYRDHPWGDESFKLNHVRPAKELVQEIFTVCDEIGYNYKLAEALPEHLQAFTVVVPDGVFTPETADYFSDEIANNSKQGGVEMPAIRILSMSQFMARGEYAGVMTEKERTKWRERATLPHYELSVAEIERCIRRSKAQRARLRGQP